MEHLNLPPDLMDLERDLAGRPRPELPAGLRGRVLGALGADAIRHRPRLFERISWEFLGATAALALLAINLSMSVANNTDWHLSPPLNLGGIEADARRIQQLVPEWSKQEAHRQAFVLAVASRPFPLPVPKPNLELIRHSREFIEWDMP